eukprot:m.59048 g.59048  ORF g.59048 m.59048 type:complete len:86 (+) comp49212_c0_seq1:457-714(+)
MFERASHEGGAPPASRDDIAALARMQVTQQHIDDATVCAVCKDHFELAENVLSLQCNHIFHEPCITPWLERHATCPTCRASVRRE